MDAGDLLKDISRDVQTIVRGEAELVGSELSAKAHTAAAGGAAALLGAMVALVGLAMLCVAAVVALAPIIPPLWLRLIAMAVVYMLLGGGLAALCARRIARRGKPDLAVAKYELARTIAGAKATITQS
ncbi:MAG TPA: phage holin family protein [Kofleriaceae bacterium]|nr:phage holin family protein [Kofleriaceae bacterium]